MIEIHETKNSLTFAVLVVPRSSKNQLAGAYDNALKIKLTAPPVEGKANQACCRFLAKSLGLPPAAVDILSGRTSRRKKVRLSFAADAGAADAIARVKKELQTCC